MAIADGWIARRSTELLDVRKTPMPRHTFKRSTLTVPLLLILATSCVSFRDQHLIWIDGVEFYIAEHKRIDELGFNPQYPNGRYIANEHYFIGKTVRPDGFIIYHYVYNLLYHSDRTCRYNLVVDPSTNVVVGWGSDQSLAEAKRNCIVSA